MSATFPGANGPVRLYPSSLIVSAARAAMVFASVMFLSEYIVISMVELTAFSLFSKSSAVVALSSCLNPAYGNAGGLPSVDVPALRHCGEIFFLTVEKTRLNGSNPSKHLLRDSSYVFYHFL